MAKSDLAVIVKDASSQSDTSTQLVFRRQMKQFLSESTSVNVVTLNQVRQIQSCTYNIV